MVAFMKQSFHYQLNKIFKTLIITDRQRNGHQSLFQDLNIFIAFYGKPAKSLHQV